MIVKYFSIFDNIAEKFGPLLPAENEAVARRMLDINLKGLTDEQKKEFSVVLVGHFDDSNGAFEGVITNECI